MRLGTSVALAAVMLGGSLAGVDAQSEVVELGACVVEVEPNDDVAAAATFEGERCVSGTLAEVGDTDVFLWRVSEQDAAVAWSLQIAADPMTSASVDLLRVDEEPDGLVVDPADAVARLDAGTAEETAASYTVEAGLYALAVSGAEPPDGVELGEDSGYELRVTRAAVAQATGSTTGDGARLIVGADDLVDPVIGSAVAVEIVLDTSGSMFERLGKKTKLDVAELELIDMVGRLPKGTPVALRTFKAKPRSCATVLRVPLEPLRPKAMSQAIRGLPARRGTMTPIAKALSEVPSDLAQAEGHRVIVLVTDGKEDCGGDPAAAIAALADDGYTSSVHLIGYALPDDETLRATMAEWATLGGGRYFDAPTRGSLAAALEAATTAPYLVFDEDGALVAQGLVGDEGVELEVGVYRVELLTDPPASYESVVLEAGAVVMLPPPAAGSAMGD